LPPATLKLLLNELATDAFAGPAASRIRLEGESSAQVERPTNRV
jgi:hypothetical protein